MEDDWNRARQRLQGMRMRRRRSHRTGAGSAWRASMMASDIGSGHNYPSEQQNGSSTDSNSTCSNIYPRKQNSFDLPKLPGKPTKMLMAEQIPKEAVIRHSSLSVIAKFMDVDEFPPCRVDPNQMKPIGRWPQKPSSEVFQDIPEVVKKSEIGKNNLSNLSSCDSDLLFSSRSSIDEKYFSSYEPLERTRENNEVKEYQNKYEWCSVQFQQQAGSRFRKDLQDLKWLELSHHSKQNINVKSLNGIKHEKNKLFYRFQGQTRRSLLKRTNKKLSVDHVLHSLKDQRASLAHTFAKLWRSEKNDTTTQPCKIIILKPSLGKADSQKRASFPARIENISLRERRQTTHSTFMDAKWTNEENFPTYVKMIGGSKSKGSRGIVKEITKYMKQSFSNNYFRDNTCVFGRHNLHNHDASQKSLGLSSAWKKSYSSSASLTEFMRRETGNEKMCHQSKETVYNGSCTRTLGEMFALSDSYEPRRKNKFPTREKRSSPAAKIPVASHNSSRFSNLDSHKEWYLIKIPKSASLPGCASNYVSSRLVQDVGSDHFYIHKDAPNLGMEDFMHRNLGRGESLPKMDFRIGSNKFHSFKYVGKEDKLPPQQMLTQTEKLEKESYIRSPEFDVFNFSDDNKVDSGNELFVSKSTRIHISREEYGHCLRDKNKNITRNDNTPYNTEEKPFGNHWIVGICNHRNQLEPQSPASSNAVVQSSPALILDLALMEDNSGCCQSSGCLLNFPTGFGVSEKLEKKYNKHATWLRSERLSLPEKLSPCGALKGFLERRGKC